MKNIMLVLAVCLLAAPALAAVTIECNQVDVNTVEVSYDAAGEPNLVRAVALDITVDNGQTITGVNDIDPNYYIHPGSFSYDAGTGEVSGSLVCDPGYPETLPGLDSNGITIEMGSLYVGAPNAPADQGVLFTFTVSGDCNVSVAENAIRGGAVMENPDATPTVNLIGCQVGPWAVGCQCWGDVSGDNQVSGTDLSMIVGYLHPAYAPGYTAPVIPGMECADVSGDNSISGTDLSMIVGYLHPAYAPGYTAPCMP
jgi:hypothetical protein